MRTLIYGDSLEGKTVELIRLIQWVLSLPENANKLAFVLNTDPGSENIWKDLPEASRIQVLNVAHFEHPLAVMRRATLGFMPQSFAGLKFQAFDKTQFCIFGMDGWSGYGDLALGAIRRDPEVVKTGALAAVRFQDGSEVFAGNSEPHYNLIQREIDFMLTNMRSWNCAIVCTALLKKAYNKRTEQMQFGPDSAGSAMVAKLPSKFEETFHQEKVNVARTHPQTGEVLQQEMFRAWFRKHFDDLSGTPFPAGLRGMPETLTEFNGFFPHGFIPCNEQYGIRTFYQWKRERFKAQSNV